MDQHAFWQQKIIQFFHDPPAKALASVRGRGGHVRVARELFDIFQGFKDGRKLRYWFKPADWAAAGADRPMLYVPRKKGVSGIGRVEWKNSPLITHPLAPGYCLRLALTAAAQEAEDAFETNDGEPRDLLKEEEAAAAALAPLLRDSEDAERLKSSFVVLWRRFQDQATASRGDDALWQEIPADTRCPDHAIWDHLKMTTALAFMKDHKFGKEVRDEGAQEPWMLRVSLGPVSTFIGQSRSARDLWISSYLLADLTWSAMEPIVERYGPDAIVYPDLRGNPRADCWLFREHRPALPLEANPSSFAAVLPAVFVALVPRGGDGHLQTIEALAAAASARVNARWRQLTDVVREWIAGQDEVETSGNAWRRIWQRQAATAPVRVSWTAIPWRPMESITDADSLRGIALPGQQPSATQPPASDTEAIQARRRRLMPWLPAEAWGHYELARDVYAHAQLDLHQMERGFDYALTHHQLRVRHAMRSESDAESSQAEEPGEKCTLCGIREALRAGDGDARNLPLSESRKAAQTFWSYQALDPDETGHERLCTVCATKRFLVAADRSSNQVFNRLWAGMDTSDDKIWDRDGKVRVPFPATATIAAQAFIERIARDGRFKAEMDTVVAACRRARVLQTSFPRALPRLAALSREGDDTVKQFLMYEAEDVLFSEVADGKARAQEAREEGRSGWRDVKAAVTQLRHAVEKQDIDDPERQIAVIRLDGDQMGKLLLGEKEAIATRWRDVLHPIALNRVERNQYLLQAGWADLLDCRRLMGPALHAYISRALGHFSHRIVPWVVEREFSGRLIYAGGDDVLCLAPASEAIDLAARLQQLFSAAWVVDTEPPTDQWGWRRTGWNGRYDPEQARRRFVVPLPRGGDDIAIMFDSADQPVATHAADASAQETMKVDGALLPMLGAGASLSAGIAVGHYKTPLSVLLARSKELLDFAKRPPGVNRSADKPGEWHGRRAVAVGHASRGGEKTRFAIPWGDDQTDRTRTAQARMRATISGFTSRKLAGRLPYQLRALGLSALCGLQQIDAAASGEERKREARERLLQGLFNDCVTRSATNHNELEAAFAVWRQGIVLHGSSYHDYTDGLLFCREMARGGGSGDDA